MTVYLVFVDTELWNIYKNIEDAKTEAERINNGRLFPCAFVDIWDIVE